MDVLVAAARASWGDGRRAQAAALLTDAFRQGLRDPAFLDDYADALSELARYAELLERRAELTAEGLALSPRLRERVAHAKLALRHNRVREIALAAERQDDPSWASPERLMQDLARACRAGRPFSFVRMDEDDARFSIAVDRVFPAPLDPDERELIGERVWAETFGRTLATEASDDLDDFAQAHDASIANADVLGVTGVRRMGEDGGCYGYLAAQADRLRRTCSAVGPGRRFTDARNASELNRLSPHLARMLRGLPFLGVVSAYPGLAERLCVHLAIPRHGAYGAPARGRRSLDENPGGGGAGFPHGHLELVDALETPFPGAVFLVAAGLPGKIYCDRIKQLGGVAIDIADLADVWMGRSFDRAPPQARREDLERIPGRRAWA